MLGLDSGVDEAERHFAHAERVLVLRGDSSDLGVLCAEQAKRAAAAGRPEDAIALATEAVRLVGEDVRYLGAAIHALATAHAVAGATAEAEQYYGEACTPSTSAVSGGKLHTSLVNGRTSCASRAVPTRPWTF
jgi:hypothetical protein